MLSIQSMVVLSIRTSAMKMLEQIIIYTVFHNMNVLNLPPGESVSENQTRLGEVSKVYVFIQINV